jgi:hypothetical protein
LFSSLKVRSNTTCRCSGLRQLFFHSEPLRIDVASELTVFEVVVAVFATLVVGTLAGGATGGLLVVDASLAGVDSVDTVAETVVPLTTVDTVADVLETLVVTATLAVVAFVGVVAETLAETLANGGTALAGGRFPTTVDTAVDVLEARLGGTVTETDTGSVGVLTATLLPGAVFVGTVAETVVDTPATGGAALTEAVPRSVDSIAERLAATAFGTELEGSAGGTESDVEAVPVGALVATGPEGVGVPVTPAVGVLTGAPPFAAGDAPLVGAVEVGTVVVDGDLPIGERWVPGDFTDRCLEGRGCSVIKGSRGESSWNPGWATSAETAPTGRDGDRGDARPGAW